MGLKQTTEKQINKNKQKLRAISWAMIASTLMAVGGGFLVKTNSHSVEHHEEKHLCGAGSANESFDDLPTFEPSGFKIPSWKDDPQLPPGTGGGHICISYEYLENSRRRFFMVHMGFKNSGASRVDSHYLFENFNDFAYLDISPELMTIPNNYRFQANGTVYSCHDLSSFVRKEQAVPYEDEDFHAILSPDKDVRYEKRSFVNISSDTKRCTICGKTISKPSWSN